MTAPARLIPLVCLAEVLTMVGVFAFPALLPLFLADWGLSNTEAGWIAGMFYAGYTVAVPVLMSLTDRVDARLIHIAGAALAAVAYAAFAGLADGFWSATLWWTLAGVGLAGTYMPGLRTLVDRLGGQGESRAVAFYTSCFSLGTALSFLLAGEIGARFGWRAALAVGAATAGLAALLMALALRPVTPKPPDQPTRLLDFRPILGNRPALGYMLGYGAHTLELFAFRAWLVAFLAFSLSLGADGGPAPTVIATVASLVAVASSIIGQELGTRFGRRRTIALTLAVAVLAAGGIGFAAALPYAWTVGLILAYAVVIQADSASLTAGVVAAAEPGRRGATLALHSVMGFAGGFVGPFALGVILDLMGGATTPLAWGLAFAFLSLTSALGLWALAWSGGGFRSLGRDGEGPTAGL